MTKKHTPPPKPHGRNMIAEKLKALREGRDLTTGELTGQLLTQKRVAELVAEAIDEILPTDAPIKQRHRRKEHDRNGDAEIFRREDVSKIEAGTRHVRDYELVALAKVFEVSVDQLTGQRSHE